MKKISVGVIFGGTNTEHEVSLMSAKAVYDNLDKDKFEVIPIKITKENTWIIPKELHASYTPALGTGLVSADKSLDSVSEIMETHSVDVIFPVLHGPYGEDGTIQGLLELMRLPYVGCGVASSAVCMDKILQKNVCESYNIPVTRYFWFTKGEWTQDKTKVISSIMRKFSSQYPLFVKPANQGSSVGVHKAHNETELFKGISEALSRDTRILIEKAVNNAREIECSVLGLNESPQTSVLGEIIPDHEFYDYDSKYLSGKSKAIIPAKLSDQISNRIRECAKLAFQVLDCSGLARIDFLVDSETDEYYLNELNTMPGFTPISMYPKLWEASGLSYQDLLTRLIDIAITKKKEKELLNFSR